jgi:hypothetical protein
VQVYAGLVARLLLLAAWAEVRGALASQLQTTREQQVDPAAASAWLRLVASSKGRPVADVARGLLGPDGQGLAWAIGQAAGPGPRS